MNSNVKTVLVFAGLLLAVVVAAFLYSRSIEPGGGAPRTAAAANPVPAAPGPEHPALATATAAAREGRYEDALEAFAGVPPTDPAYVIARRGYGSVQVELGRAVEALDTFDGLLRLASEDPEVRVARSWALFHLGRYAEAEAETLRALEIDPQNVAARYNVAFFRVMQERLPEAIPAYQRALRNDTGGTYLTRAIEDLAVVADRDPERYGVHYALAFFANTQGRTDTEIEELEKFLAVAPEGPTAETARRRLAEASASAS